MTDPYCDCGAPYPTHVFCETCWEKLEAEIERLRNELLKARQLFQDQLLVERAENERLRGRLDWWSTWMDKYYNTPLNNSVYHPERTDPTIIERIEAMEATVAKLPKDAEGKPIAPDDHRWCVHDDGRIEEVVAECIHGDSTVHVGGLPGVNDACWDELADELYGTHEAAKAAREMT